MSAARTSSRLLRLFPGQWRQRYGAELEALIVEASGGGGVPLKTGLDVARAGLGERLRACGLQPDDSPSERARANVLRVLCAWALFVCGGLVVGKFSEHWQGAVPPGGALLAEAAFVAIVAAAGIGSALVFAGIGAAIPAFIRLLQDGGWSRIRRPLLLSGLVGCALAAATAGLALWAGSLDPGQRNGGDSLYAAAFLAWAVMVFASLAAWTGAAVGIARRLELRPRVVRFEAWLCAGVAAAMVVVTGATALWWTAVAADAPRLFRSGGSALAPQLFVALALMVLALLFGGPAGWRALREAPRISALS